VLNPELRAALLQKHLDLLARRRGLLLVGIKCRNALHGALFRVMIQVATQQHRPRFLEFQEQHLMTRRVARRQLDHDGAIAEDVVIGGRNDDRLAVFERRVVGRIHLFVRKRGREHGVALHLAHQPCGARELVGVGYVIVVIMREGQVLDIRRLVTNLLHLRLQRLCNGGVPFQRRFLSRLERAIGDRTHVPHQRAFGMDNQETPHREVGGCELFFLESEPFRIRNVETAAVEYVQAERLGRRWRSVLGTGSEGRYKNSDGKGKFRKHGFQSAPIILFGYFVCPPSGEKPPLRVAANGSKMVP
jgi:hypothetical protein